MFEKLIGLEITKAKEILNADGYNNIEVIMNSEHDDKCDTTIVCAVKQDGDSIKLICGEFFLKLKKE